MKHLDLARGLKPRAAPFPGPNRHLKLPSSLWVLACTLLALASAGCTTEGFCFANCEELAGPDTGSAQGGAGGLPNLDARNDAPLINLDSGTDADACNPGPEELCNGLDDDCDNQIDEGIDFSNPANCGTCDHDCRTTTLFVDEVTCASPSSPGTPGTCGYKQCAQDFYDVDGDPTNGCEYYCQWNPTGANTTDPGGANGCLKDDDCDNQIDEDVDTCDDVENCGECGRRCSLGNATAKCITADTTAACKLPNTNCQVDVCDADYYNVDGAHENGCEYLCPTAAADVGPELCDGRDNDCDGRIDNVDSDLESADPDLGDACFGGTVGLCVDPAHQGIKKCIGGAITCCDSDSNNLTATNPNLPNTGIRNGECDSAAGPQVLRPGDEPETCDNVDDDCDGAVDDNPIDAGSSCGSSTGNCQTGTRLCVAGMLQCAGFVGPQPDLCNGQDDDCDGVIDGAKPAGAVTCNADADCASQAPNLICRAQSPNPNDKVCVKPPADVADDLGFLLCNVPVPPPAGTPSPCRSGAFQCVGSVRVCQGSITAQQSTDNCFEDTNCDGQLTDQTGIQNSDPRNCGACGNDCNTQGQNAIWTCNAGQCVRSGCQPGFINCDANPSDCERPCTFQSSTETCDNDDDDCDCQVDEGVSATPVQVCNVSPAATEPACLNVARACSAGAWSCSFAAGYCGGGNPPSCSTTTDTCDGRDNDCDGVSDESFKPPAKAQGFLGQACFSDDGLGISHGPCRTAGTYVCRPDGTDTQCNAVKDNSKATPERCDSVDNDCDGAIDDNLAATDPDVGDACFGGTLGECIDPSHQGAKACVNGAIVCQGANLLSPGQKPEICDALDNDCDGVLNDNPTDAGGTCGSGVGSCTPGARQCIGIALQCVGGTGPQAEVCNGQDDNCDGTIDNSLTDVGGPCDVPPPKPAPTAQCPTVTQPCQGGTLACVAGVLDCAGEIDPPQATDNCCDDTNCDGQLTNQPSFLNDVRNCGGCGNDCAAISPTGHGIWACQAGSCVRTGCEPGYYNCDGNANDCEDACLFASPTELCNGEDDNCDCAVDNLLPGSTPSPVQVCGVAAAATDVGCTTGVSVACQSGGWRCTFPANYCNGGSPASCATTQDVCDTRDNNCNGGIDENFKPPVLTQGYVGQPCASDDGLPAPGHGVCKGLGTFQCTGPSTTACNAVKDNAQVSPEACDELDNDCDGSVDETYLAKGTNSTHFVKPAVVQIASAPNARWLYTYEASRPEATLTGAGTGNGYHCTGSGCSGVPQTPANTPLDRTRACSVPDKVPWFNVTPIEVEQTCQAMGGSVCATADWRRSCEVQTGVTCRWGYDPRGPDCTSASTASKFCNLGPFDFNGGVAGDQDGLLPTASPLLQHCFSDWNGLQGNPNPGDDIFDITGNLREITKSGANVYPLMGGAFDTSAETGAECNFTFFSVDQSFKLYDTGFRCCFTSDPRI